MKKYFAILAGLLFVFGFAASAFAIHAEIPAETSAIVVKGETLITLGGELRWRGEIREDDFNSDSTSRASYDGRVRLSLDAKVAPNAQGFVQLETGSSDTGDTWRWGDEAGGSGVYGAGAGAGNAKKDELRIIQAWAQYKTDVVGLKVGHMPLALGNKIFFNHTKFGDDAILLFADPNKNVHLAALTIKFEDGGDSHSEDQDAYVVLGVFKGGTFNVSGDLTYVVMNSGSTAAAGFGGPSDVINLGVRGDVNVGPVLIRGDIEVQTGTIAKDAAAEQDVVGNAIVIGADFNLGPAKLTVEGGMGSGDDDAADDEFGLFITSLGAHGNAPLYTYVYDYRVAGACNIPGVGSCGTSAGIANTTYAKVGASAKLTKDLGLKGQLVWLQATEEVGGEDEIGIELDFKLTYQMAKNLKYWVEGGYLMAGDFFKNAPTVPAGEDPDDAYAVRHGIALNF